MNGQDANAPADAVFVKAGAPVTWTYRVHGDDVDAAHERRRCSDDNGTPGNTADDFTPTFVGRRHELERRCSTRARSGRTRRPAPLPAGLYGNVALAERQGGAA